MIVVFRPILPLSGDGGSQPDYKDSSVNRFLPRSLRLQLLATKIGA